jgi:hypothetical protein
MRLMAAFCGLLVTLPQLAHAGALGQVMSGLSSATGNSGNSSGGKGAGNSGGGSSNSTGWAGSESSGVAQPPWEPMTYGAPAPSSTDPVDIFAYFGVQSVVDSDGSMTAEVRATHKKFGITVRGTSFFERNTDGMSGYMHLDLGSLSGDFRVVRDGRLQMWIETGGTMLSTTTGITLLGAQAGTWIDWRAGGLLGLSGEARYVLMQDRVRFLELRSSISLSIVRLSYRIVDFNVGPPLHGPELGVALTF